MHRVLLCAWPKRKAYENRNDRVITEKRGITLALIQGITITQTASQTIRPFEKVILIKSEQQPH